MGQTVYGRPTRITRRRRIAIAVTLLAVAAIAVVAIAVAAFADTERIAAYWIHATYETTGSTSPR